MMKVTVKNNSAEVIHVPFSSIVPGSAVISNTAEPGESASCVFRVPTYNTPVQEAIEAWAESNGVDIEMSFTPAPMPLASQEG